MQEFDKADSMYQQGMTVDPNNANLLVVQSSLLLAHCFLLFAHCSLLLTLCFMLFALSFFPL